MILYLDSSALAKLFVAESGSECVQQGVADAAAVVTHLIAYAEIRAMLAKAVRMGRVRADDLDTLVLEFERRWAVLDVVGVTETLIRRAGALAHAHGLRGYDSVHLAALLGLRDELGPGAEIRFDVYDSGLRAAALARDVVLMSGC